MVKTTVYIDEEQAVALRRISARTGRSQAQIIRDAISRETSEAPPRVFKSHGVGRGTGEPIAERADEILRREFGLRKLPRP
jgi:hypothetical protein